MLAEFIQPQKTALNYSLTCARRLNPTNTTTMHDSSYAPTIQFSQGATRLCGHTTNLVQGKLRLLTQPGNSHNSRRNFAQAVYNAHLVEFTLDLTLLNEPSNSATQSLVYSACCPTWALHPFKKVDYNGISFNSLNITNNNLNLQLHLPDNQIPTRFPTPAVSLG
ncbi:hypothetical protein ES703_87449 [subsurface metagenome]